MRFLVTRPQPDCRRTADKLRAMGHVADESPLLLFRGAAPEQFDLETVSALAFTSRRAVSVVAAHAQFEVVRKLPVFSVGSKTAATCRESGFANIVSANGDVDDLGQVILQHRDQLQGGAVLYPMARDRAGDLEGFLAEGNVSCVPVVVYEMEQAGELPVDVVQNLRSGAYDGVLVFSKRTAEALILLLKAYGLDHIFSSLSIYSISRQAAKPLSDYMRVHVATAPCEKSLLDLALAEC
ncbi:MAG: uroporphyrinogen-III synthase [Roseibium sp.]|uniref:uroporphyrinogen-III synthase n=1 Tax=Roseibium sp. TaxID=1936156 RepID=UPI002613948F|nr:uroporphyrinogen-III synthase [Roseibium sp.]MCV0426149.1 uroporphyrinogen-III synthase [Roseibium sp.]